MVDPVTEYAAVAVTACALTGLGSAPARLLGDAQQRVPLLRLPLMAIAGWGLAAFASAVGAAAGSGQVWLARTVLVVGLALLIPLGRRRASQFALLGELALVLLLVAPTGILVAGTPAMAYDEFAQWLPNSRFLVEQGRYWGWPEWQGLSSKPGYPNASAVIALLVNQLAGPDVEAPFKTFVVFLLGGFGAALAGLAATRCVPDRESGGRLWRATIALLPIGVLAALVDPFIDPRIAFTAYTDTPSAIVLAIVVLAACYAVDAARRGDHPAAAHWFGWSGLLGLTLVLLRTTNLVLVGAFWVGAGLLLLVQAAASLSRWSRWALLLCTPPALGLGVWQVHLWQAHIGPDITPKTFALWDWSAPATLARAFLFDRLAGNPLVGGGALALAAIAVTAGWLLWRRRGADADDRLPPARIVIILAAIVSVCFVGFLAWAYIAVFSPDEVATAASLWRYLSELGPMLVLAAASIVLSRIRPGLGSRRLCAALFAGVAGLILLPYLGASYERLDCRYPDIAAARAAIAELRPALEPFAAPPPHPARVAVVAPEMGDWLSYALAFDMGWPASNQLVRWRRKAEPLAQSEAWAWDEGLDALLDFTPLDRVALKAKAAIPPVSLLVRPKASGEPWPVSDSTAPRPLPRCRPWGRL